MNTLSTGFVLVFLCLLISVSLEAQQLRTRYANIQDNLQNLNSGAINHLGVGQGLNGAMGMLSARYQSQSIDAKNKIEAQEIRYEHIDLNANILFGGGLTLEEVHIHKFTRIAGNFSYLIDKTPRGGNRFKKDILSLGGGFAANFQSTDLTRLRYDDPTDAVLPISSSQYYTVSAGAFYLHKREHSANYYLGFSAFHNIESPIAPASTQFFFVGGVIFSSPKNVWHYEPNVAIRRSTHDGFITTLPASPLSMDAGIRIRYDEQRALGFFAGANAGTNGRGRAEVGLLILPRKIGSNKHISSDSNSGKRRNATATNAIKIGYTYDFQYARKFNTPVIQEVFLAYPIPYGK